MLYYVLHETASTGSASLKNASVLVEAKPCVLVLHQAWADHVTARFAPFLKKKKSVSRLNLENVSDTEVSHHISEISFCQTN